MAMDDAPAPALKRKVKEPPELWAPGEASPVSFPRATKIRRLDAEVMMPHVVPGVLPPPEPEPEPAMSVGIQEVPMCGAEDVAPVGVALAPAANEERAIVVYQPADAARSLLLGPLRPGTPLRVSPDWIDGLKSTMLQLQEAGNQRALLEALAGGESSNLNLAMVPWAPPSHAHAASTTAAEEMMDADDSEGACASMEVEQDRCAAGAEPSATGAAAALGEAHHPWPPQHCMVQQQLLPAASYQPSPVAWSWTSSSW